jgi:hypothetical protein
MINCKKKRRYDSLLSSFSVLHMVSLSKSPFKKKKLSKEHLYPFELDSIWKIENTFAKFRIENLSVNTVRIYTKLD